MTARIDGPCSCGACHRCDPRRFCRWCDHYVDECECENERDDAMGDLIDREESGYYDEGVE